MKSPATASRQHRASLFHAQCLKHGLHHRACGFAAVEAAQKLRDAPLPLAQRLEASRRGNNAIGSLILAGLVTYDTPQKLYRLTPKGTAWLDALASHGLLSLLDNAA